MFYNTTEFYLQLFLLTLEFERGGGEAGGREVGVGGGAGEHGAVLPPRHRPVAQHGPDQASLLHSVLGRVDKTIFRQSTVEKN